MGQRLFTSLAGLALGSAFAREVEAAIARVLEAPERWHFVEQDIRRCLTRVFPDSILYTVEKNFVLIVAVAHGSREPEDWRGRIAS